MSPYALGTGASDYSQRIRTAIPSFDPAVLKDTRVVVVEDEAIIQMQLRRILTRIGAQIVGTATNGKSGVQVVESLKPDITLMDIKMASEADGLEAARQLLSVQRRCVVMLTAYEEYRDEANSIGACAYILKPIDSATLIPQLASAYRLYLDSNNDLMH